MNKTYKVRKVINNASTFFGVCSREHILRERFAITIVATISDPDWKAQIA